MKMARKNIKAVRPTPFISSILHNFGAIELLAMGD
jgi:hypothetical protein